MGTVDSPRSQYIAEIRQIPDFPTIGSPRAFSSCREATRKRECRTLDRNKGRKQYDRARPQNKR